MQGGECGNLQFIANNQKRRRQPGLATGIWSGWGGGESVLWDWVLNLWDLMLSPGRQNKNVLNCNLSCWCLEELRIPWFGIYTHTQSFSLQTHTTYDQKRITTWLHQIQQVSKPLSASILPLYNKTATLVLSLNQWRLILLKLSD